MYTSYTQFHYGSTKSINFLSNKKKYFFFSNKGIGWDEISKRSIIFLLPGVTFCSQKKMGEVVCFLITKRLITMFKKVKEKCTYKTSQKSISCHLRCALINHFPLIGMSRCSYATYRLTKYILYDTSENDNRHEARHKSKPLNNRHIWVPKDGWLRVLWTRYMQKWQTVRKRWAAY